jgi:hypothetical protein
MPAFIIGMTVFVAVYPTGEPNPLVLVAAFLGAWILLLVGLRWFFS